MSLEAKGRIKYNPDVKPSDPSYTLECTQLGIYAEGSGNLPQMVDELTERVRRGIAQEFMVSPSSVDIIGYSMGITFSIDGPINHTLDDFQKESSGNTVSIQFPGKDPIETTPEKIALAAMVLKKSQETGIPPEDILAAAKKRAKEEGAP